MAGFDIIKILLPALVSFTTGILFTPILTYFLYKFRVWKKSGGKKSLDGKEAVEFNKLHKDLETKTPRMGGIVIWFAVFFTTMFFWVFSKFMGTQEALKLDYISRSQTWIPLFVMLVGAFVGFINDLFDVSYKDREMHFMWRVLIVAILSLFVGYWFYVKLGISSISIPFDGYLYLGIFFIPFFIILSIALYASGIIDGIDGLSGGVFMFIFLAYSAIAFTQNQLDISAFAASVSGALGAFLWFNIPPARFYMTETGSMPLTLVIATLAVMTDKMGGGIGVTVLPIIALLLFVTLASVVLQVLSKKIFHKKIFKIAPLHHHFEAIGWPSYKVVMRYWILGIFFALTGVFISLIA